MIETNAILAISSLDRYTTQNTDAFNPVSPDFTGPATQNYALVASYNNAPPYSDDFQINTPGVLTYGYISKIILSQIQLQYNIPTVSVGLNDSIPIRFTVAPGVGAIATVDLPYGFYTPSELAAIAQIQINNNPAIAPSNITVTYSQDLNQFEFVAGTANRPFYFPNLQQLVNEFGQTSRDFERYLKTYKLFGIGADNSVASQQQISQLAPNFLYTPYIDIYSNALTAYQKLSDGNSTVARPKGLIARVYLSGVGGPQITSSTQALGSRRFDITFDLNSPKVIKWTKDVAINSIDFQMRDCYGDLIPGVDVGFSTEFQITLLCIEGEQEY
jgi:hypothetical protein